MSTNKAIVRAPGSRYSDCLSSHPLKRTIDLVNARNQHARYCAALSELGMEVICLEMDDEHPDSCFVEDVAVVHNGKALMCRTAKESRQGEEGPVRETLSQYVSIGFAAAPATIEGGDVVHFDDRLICGITQRTNDDGAEQMGEWLEIKIDVVRDPKIMHLKSYMSSLGTGRLLVTERYADTTVLGELDLLVVPSEEWYGSNVIAVDDSVIMSKGYPRTEAILKSNGYRVIALDMTEFPKCEGALTCLSILF
ncbi:MAG: hypothetical protein KKE24_01620 [Candidatus Thermoplasmatota archaeon]|nr:hypothetical protein [Candidatus Thermoplasmatota archaeon]